MKFNSENLILPLAKLLQLIARLILFLPEKAILTLFYFLAEALSLPFKLSRLKKETAQNLEKIFPNKYSLPERQRLANKLLGNLSRSILEIIALPFLSSRLLNKMIEVKGLENLNRVLSEGKGAVLLSLHTGNSESAQIGLRNLGFPVNMIVRDPLKSGVFKFLALCRSSKGARLINVEAENMYREAAAALKRNEIVGLAVDTGALEGKHFFIKMLGRKMPVAAGWKALAQRSGAAVIPVFTKRAANKNIVFLNRPYYLSKDEKEVETAFQEIAKIFEAYISEDPSNWAFFLSSHEVDRLLTRLPDLSADRQDGQAAQP